MSEICSLVQSTGPGEINDVCADIRALVDDDDAVSSSMGPQLAAYNKEQFMTANVDGETVILSKYSELEEGKFFSASQAKQFSFDHVNLKASGIEPYDVPQAAKVKSFTTALESYVEEHYPSSSACSVTPSDERLELCIVGNKYNTANFWTGRWRSHYTVASTDLKGSIKVDVHYYEDGNVRLLTTKDVSVTCPSTDPNAIVKAIERAEREYQEELNRAFGVLGEGSFKDLRRALPVTRSKINWNSVSAMRIGQEVQGGREKKK